MAENGIGKKLFKVGLQDTYAHGASKMYLLKKYGLDAMTLIDGAQKLTGESFGIGEHELKEIRFEDFTAV